MTESLGLVWLTYVWLGQVWLTFVWSDLVNLCLVKFG